MYISTEILILTVFHCRVIIPDGHRSTMIFEGHLGQWRSKAFAAMCATLMIFTAAGTSKELTPLT